MKELWKLLPPALTETARRRAGDEGALGNLRFHLRDAAVLPVGGPLHETAARVHLPLFDVVEIVQSSLTSKLVVKLEPLAEAVFANLE